MRIKFCWSNHHVTILLAPIGVMVNLVLHGQVDGYGVPQRVHMVRHNVHSVVLWNFNTFFMLKPWKIHTKTVSSPIWELKIILVSLQMVSKSNQWRLWLEWRQPMPKRPQTQIDWFLLVLKNGQKPVWSTNPVGRIWENTSKIWIKI